MTAIDDLIGEARSAVASAEAVAGRAARDARAFLASPQGRQMRANVARGLVTVAPLLAAAPVLRRTWVGRVLGVAGAATVLVKVAEAIRDWDPVQHPAG